MDNMSQENCGKVAELEDKEINVGDEQTDFNANDQKERKSGGDPSSEASDESRPTLCEEGTDTEVLVKESDHNHRKEVSGSVDGKEMFKDVERDMYEMMRNEEAIYVSKTRKIVQFILFLLLVLVGGFLVLLSRGLLFAQMVSDTTTNQLAQHGIHGK